MWYNNDCILAYNYAMQGTGYKGASQQDLKSSATSATHLCDYKLPSINSLGTLIIIMGRLYTNKTILLRRGIPASLESVLSRAFLDVSEL